MNKFGVQLPIASVRYVLWFNGALVAVMLLAAAALGWQGFYLAPVFVWGAGLAQALLTLGVWGALWRGVKRDSAVIFGVLLVSMGNLSFYLYGLGGHTNPLISLLLVPLALSAVMLRWQWTLWLALSVLLFYTLLTRFFIPLSLAHSEAAHATHGHEDLMQLHLLGMWLTFAISALLICLLVIPLASSVRQQQALISGQREKILQDEQLVALATFAASSAHKMGTPLSTLSILIDDFREVVDANPQWQADRELMASQIGLCKTILQDMMRKADGLRQNIHEPIKISALVLQLREQFNLLHPRFALQIENSCAAESYLRADITLEQALLNLLDNAVKASDSAPMLSIRSVNGQVLMSIEDTGPGIPETIRQQLGQPLVGAREDGMGLGLFLSHATINRLGGSLTLFSSDHGTIIEVLLPLVHDMEEVKPEQHD